MALWWALLPWAGFAAAQTGFAAAQSGLPAAQTGPDTRLVLNPQICIGYDPVRNVWGLPPQEPTGERLCSANQAIFSAVRGNAGMSKRPFVAVLAVCCPLPSDDILTQQHTWEMESCPEHSIVTGYDAGENVGGTYIARIRCTALNTARYRLGEAQGGAFWGTGSSAALPWKENTTLLRAGIPPAIRYGIERFQKVVQVSRGCIGQPAGSLFTAKLGFACKDFQFKELFAVGPGELLRPVQMFPDCKQVSNLFSPNPECIR